MATSNSQRIGIWTIAVVMVVGTIGSFFIVVVANQNQAVDQKIALEEYQQNQEDAMKAQEAAEKAREEARKANRPLRGYDAAPFDADKISKLEIEVLNQGKGQVLKNDSTILSNYFGWTSDGKIFDSTNKNGITTPVEFSLTGVIEGWTKGLTGIKVGSTVKLTIPGDMAYGNEDRGDGRPYGPLAFVVEVVELK